MIDTNYYPHSTHSQTIPKYISQHDTCLFNRDIYNWNGRMRHMLNILMTYATVRNDYLRVFTMSDLASSKTI